MAKIFCKKMSNEPGKIFVGGVSWDIKQEGLRAYFEKFGKVKDAVIMTDPDSFPPRDFGIVTFEDPSIVESVCSQEHILDAKKPATARAKTVVVVGLAQGTSREDLETYFKQYGTVTKVNLNFDRQTHRMTEFGFVEFDSEDTVDKLVEIHFHTINGKLVKVKKAEDMYQPHQHYPVGYNAGVTAGSQAPYYNNYQQSGQQQAVAAATAAAYGYGYVQGNYGTTQPTEYGAQTGYGYGYGQGNYGTTQPTGYGAQTGYGTQGTYSQTQAGYGQQQP